MTGLLSSAPLDDFPVMSVGVWHSAQPIWLNRLEPLEVESVAGAGVGGAKKRMKIANFTTSLGVDVSNYLV